MSEGISYAPASPARPRPHALHSTERLTGPRCVISREAAGYPDALLRVPEPPERLYVVGDPAVLTEGLAVVGARKATPYGISCARRFAGHAAAAGIPVISGGARGCDGAAHRAALEAGGKTVVFLGGGCDKLYPEAHAGLFQEVIDRGGAVVSEQSWDFPPMRHTFRARNRLIAGLAKATLIVEAGLPSGTFSTADEALAASREVLVVPGSILAPTSRGANRLIYQGATPVIDDEAFSDILGALFGTGYAPTPAGQKPPAGARASAGGTAAPPGTHRAAEGGRGMKGRLCAALLASPMHFEEMLAAMREEPCPAEAPGTRDAMTELVVCLTELERDGKVARYPDGRYGPVLPREFSGFSR